MRKTQLIFLLILCCIKIHAFTYNNINYNVVTANTVEVGNNRNCILTEINIPGTAIDQANGKVYSVVSISDNAFEASKNVHTVNISENITSISSHSFFNCENLTNINVSKNLIKVGARAFDKTKWYDERPTGEVYLMHILYAFKGSMEANTTVKINEGVSVIASAAFWKCSDLTGIQFPASLKHINYAAFYNCVGLSSILLPSGVTHLENNTFQGCTNLKSVELPNSLTHIGKNAFADCVNLTSINIPDKIDTIETCAFLNCSALLHISIPSTNSFIGSDAMRNTQWQDTRPSGIVRAGKGIYQYKGVMSAGESVALSENDAMIAGRAFAGQTNLYSITIPNGLKYIGALAFQGCTGLKSIYCNAQDPPILDRYYSNSPFDQVDRKTCTLYVPYGTKNKYASDTYGWGEFLNIKEVDTALVDNKVDFSIYVVERTIHIKSPHSEIGEKVFIYNIAGALLYQDVLDSTEKKTIKLPIGIYIVNIKDAPNLVLIN